MRNRPMGIALLAEEEYALERLAELAVCRRGDAPERGVCAVTRSGSGGAEAKGAMVNASLETVLKRLHASQSQEDRNQELLDAATTYVKDWGWYVVPCYAVDERTGQCTCRQGARCTSPGKHPIPRSGFKEATNDVRKVRAWWGKQTPGANIGINTEKSGLVVIDGDEPEILKTWYESLGLPAIAKTVSVETPRPAIHDYYAMNGQPVKSLRGSDLPSSALPRHIDSRAVGGMVIAPPSNHTNGRYQWAMGSNPGETELLPCPKAISRTIPYRPKSERTKSVGLFSPRPQHSENLSKAAGWLKALPSEWANDRELWIRVGMSLSELGDDGLALWDSWSRQSPKHQEGECAQKWAGFTPGEGLTLASLRYWAKDAQTGSSIARKDMTSADYMAALTDLGYTFRMNSLFDEIEVNGLPISDPIAQTIRRDLRDVKIGAVTHAEDCYAAHAYEHQFHPIRDYLDGLEWDGSDAIGALASYLKDTDGLFAMTLEKFVIGCVAKAYEPLKKRDRIASCRTRMWVLEGPQAIGKSYFARWLAGPLDAFFDEKAVQPDNKDHVIELATTWIWEVSELGSTTRKADRESLKSFLSRLTVRERKPYGRHETHKPTLASFIGTVNDEGGFLADPTGHTRFMVIELLEIDRAYSVDVDVDQVWAQAKSLYDAGASWDLSNEEARLVSNVNDRFDNEDVLEARLFRWFDIDKIREDWFMSTDRIVDRVQLLSRQNIGDREATMRVGAALKRIGLHKSRPRIDGEKVRGYAGIRANDTLQR